MPHLDRFGLLPPVSSADGTEILPALRVGLGGVGGTPNCLVSVAQIGAYVAALALTPASVAATGAVTSNSPTAGIGYATGAGGAVTQATSRTTGVTLNKVCGQVTLFSAAGSASWQSFTVTNSAVGATDEINVWQVSGTDLHQVIVTNVAAGSFKISFATTGGTTTEQPVFGFAVKKGVIA
jgi:hypothetical protein